MCLSDFRPDDRCRVERVPPDVERAAQSQNSPGARPGQAEDPAFAIAGFGGPADRVSSFEAGGRAPVMGPPAGAFIRAFSELRPDPGGEEPAHIVMKAE